MPVRAGVWIHRLSRWVAPASSRERWFEEWSGRLWEWMLAAARAGDKEAVPAVSRHARHAFLWSVRARLEQWRERPATLPYVGLILLTAALLLTGGLSRARRTFFPLPYQSPGDLVILAQGPPVLGVRLGFLDNELSTFSSKAATLNGVAGYTSYSMPDGRGRVQAMNVTPNFFQLLGVAVPQGDFYVSYDYWRSHLRADPKAVGSTVAFSGRSWKLAGIAPRGFWFMNPSVEVWTVGNSLEAGPPEQWWRRLQGTVARLAPGVRAWEAEAEIRRLMIAGGRLRRNYNIIATPLGSLAGESTGMIARELAWGLAVLAAFVGLRVWRERAYRYWLYFVAKTMGPMLAIYAVSIELSAPGLYWAGQMLGVWTRGILLLALFAWAWRDQKSRCHVCLERMTLPVRIGMRGRVLLEAVGEENMCRHGHGSMYRPESILGSEMGNRWLRWV